MVARLTDEELVEELRSRGEEPGPVMDSTRVVYQRKLAKLMAEKAKGEKRRRRVKGYCARYPGHGMCCILWSGCCVCGGTVVRERR